jgi:hypothetical protein
LPGPRSSFDSMIKRNRPHRRRVRRGWIRRRPGLLHPLGRRLRRRVRQDSIRRQRVLRLLRPGRLLRRRVRRDWIRRQRVLRLQIRLRW